MKHSNHYHFYNLYIIIMHVLSHQPERVRTTLSGDCSTEHSHFAAVTLPRQFWWKLALKLLLEYTLCTAGWVSLSLKLLSGYLMYRSAGQSLPKTPLRIPYVPQRGSVSS